MTNLFVCLFFSILGYGSSSSGTPRTGRTCKSILIIFTYCYEAHVSHLQNDIGHPIENCFYLFVFLLLFLMLVFIKVVEGETVGKETMPVSYSDMYFVIIDDIDSLVFTFKNYKVADEQAVEEQAVPVSQLLLY